MNREELQQVKLMINAFGFYQAFEPVKEWFGLVGMMRLRVKISNSH